MKQTLLLPVVFAVGLLGTAGGASAETVGGVDFDNLSEQCASSGSYQACLDLMQGAYSSLNGQSLTTAQLTAFANAMAGLGATANGFLPTGSQNSGLVTLLTSVSTLVSSNGGSSSALQSTIGTISSPVVTAADPLEASAT